MMAEVYSSELHSLVKHTPEGCCRLCKGHHGYLPCLIEMADCDGSAINSADILQGKHNETALAVLCQRTHTIYLVHLPETEKIKVILRGTSIKCYTVCFCLSASLHITLQELLSYLDLEFYFFLQGKEIKHISNTFSQVIMSLI